MQVTYQIIGLDYPRVIKNTLGTVLQQVSADPSISNDEQRFNELFIKTFGANIALINRRAEPVEIKITFKQTEDQQWKMDSRDVKRLMFTFMYGTTSPEILNEEITQSMNTATNEVKSQVKSQDEQQLPSSLDQLPIEENQE